MQTYKSKLMSKFAISFLCIGLVSLGLGLAHAQTKGEVADQEFIIRKDRVLTVPTQPRIFEKLPVLPQPKGLSDFRYLVNPFSLDLPRLNLIPTPILKNYIPPKLEVLPGFLRAGYGTYNSPLLELRYMSTESEEWTYSAQLNHQSFAQGPVAREQSSQFHNHIGVDLSYFAEQVEMFGSLHWNQDNYSIYGIDASFFDDPAFETLSNTLNTIQFQAGIREIQKTGRFTYAGDLNFRNFKDSYLATENDLGINGSAKFRPNHEWTIALGMSYFVSTPEDFQFKEIRNFASIRPELSYLYDRFKFTAGVNVVYEDDVWANKNQDFKIFPKVKIKYQFADEFGFFGEYSGDVKRNTYHGFVQENQFLGPSSQLFNTVNLNHIKLGIEGQFQDIIHYKAGINLDRFDQLHFFVNSPVDTSRFELVYDEQVTVLNVNGELGFKFTEVYALSARLDWYKYEMTLLQEAWHRPTWELKINNQYKPIDKLLIQANINLMGGVKAQGQMEIDAELIGYIPVIDLKTIADLQLKADYKISNRFAVFAEGNNLVNGANLRWLNYPVRGIQVRGGVSFKF